MSDEPVVQVRDVTKRYGRNAPTLVGVSLDVPAGSIVALSGPNGSGKSTLLRCIAGLARFEGSIEVCGKPVDTRGEFRRSIGYLPQAVTLPPHASIYESIEFFARLRGADNSELPIPDGFLPPLESRVGTLSGGQRQRVAFAIALLGHPEVILLDEPVSNLDATGRESVWVMLRGLRDSGTTALIASPSPADLAGIGDRTIALEDGQIIEDRVEVAR